MDHAYYLSMSYAITALAIVAELVTLRIGRRNAHRNIEQERELETQD